MTIIDALKISLRNFRRYRLRTTLSVSGIVVGILAVSLVVALGGAVKNYILGELTAFGTDLLQINPRTPGASLFGTASARVYGIETPSLKQADVEALGQFPFVTNTASYSSAQGWATRGNREKKIMLLCSTADYPAVDGQTVIERGRFYSSEEDRVRAKVIVIGSGVYDRLFGGGEALGDTVRINANYFQVAGVLKPRGQVFGMNFDDMAFIPLNTCQKTILNVDYISEGAIKLIPGTSQKDATAQFENLMRRRHSITDPRKDDFVITTMEQTISIVSTVIGVMQLLLILLAGISLLVGGVGIMNVMLVSVNERLHEIGIRKAFGATQKEVFVQFIVESVMLTSIGGVVGTALSALLVLLVGVIVRSQGYAWHLSFPFSSVLMAVLVSAFVGIIFGIYPARKASRMEPIAALRVA